MSRVAAMRTIIVLLLICVTAAAGQERSSLLVKRQSLHSGLVFQHWSTFENDEKVNELVLPLVVHYRPSERFSVSVLNTPTRAQYVSAGADARLTAFTDTRVATALVLGEERGLLNFGINFPSGPTNFEPGEELLVAQKITNRVLAMPTSYFGGGWEFSTGLAYAFEAGKWVVGMATSGTYKGSYVPIAGAKSYQPGPEISLSFGLDRPLGENHRLYGDVSYTWYGRDKSGGQEVFQADGKFSASLASLWHSENWRLALQAQNRFRRKSPFALTRTLSVSYGNELEFAVELAQESGQRGALLAVGDVRIHSANDQGWGKATVFGLGPGWRGNLSQQLQMQTVARFSAGKLNDTKIWGVELNLGLILQL